MDYASAWSEIQRGFGLDGLSLSPEYLSEATVEFVKKGGLTNGVLEYVQAELEKRLRTDVVPSFWHHFELQTSVQTEQQQTSPIEKERFLADLFHRAVTDLYVHCSSLAPVIQRMDMLAKQANFSVHAFGQKTYGDLFSLLLKGTLHCQMPKQDFRPPVHAFYSRAFHVFHVRRDGNERMNRSINNTSGCTEDEDSEEVALECEGCKRESEDRCECNSIISSFHDANRKLLELNILERLTGDTVTNLVHTRIQRHVSESCTGSFTISHLQPLSDWLDAVVMGWMRLLYSATSTGIVADAESNRILRVFRQRLAHFLYETYTKARIDQLFNIIIEFPESQAALEDLRECLNKTDLRAFLTQSLKKVLERKLLHLGVNTTDILTAYIAAIRALRVLDPSGVLLELVCEPVRKYLRTRDDTVRCIVQSLIDDSSNELAEELMKSEGLCLDESFLADGSAEGGDQDPEEMAATWTTWQPDPVDADPAKMSQSRQRRSLDIISMLVNIYGSKELFVNEYRSLLSNRLLSQFTYDTEREIRNLELLKLRFGEAPLHHCEVMLKDIGDSKRINTRLHSEESGEEELAQQDFPVNAIIISPQFWPQFKQETLHLPEEVLQSLEAYTRGFEAMKGNRTLVWKTHLGLVNLDLQIGDKKINLTVSPVHAAIIYQFQVKSEWMAEDLGHTLKIPVSTLRRRIAFWQTQGLVKETGTDKYTLIEEGPMRRMSGVSGEVTAEDEECESVTRTSRDQRAEELQVFWSYIVNMLINLESLPLDRIFQMLKMFAMQGPSAVECNIEELRSFLDEKVRQHELLFAGGQYKMPKT